jgi:hypothetical protein
MSKITVENRGKRPRFFPESGNDEQMSMILELMSEVWIVRERMFALEQVAAEAGLPLAEKLENWQPSDAQAKELDTQRNRALLRLTMCRACTSAGHSMPPQWQKTVNN